MKSYVLTPNGVTVYVQGKPVTVEAKNRNYKKVCEAIEKNSPDEEILSLASAGEVPVTVEEAVKTDKRFTIEGDKVFFLKDSGVRVELNNILCKYILKLANHGMSLDPIEKFVTNMMQNPSYDARERMFNFLQHEGLPITPDGCFLAYKYVGNDYYDLHSGTVLYEIGTEVSEPREECDDNPNNPCSRGLHVGSLAYASHGPKTLILKVNPRDVVTVPVSESEKMRTCKVFVVKEYEKPLTGELYNERGEEENLNSLSFEIEWDDIAIGDYVEVYDYANRKTSGQVLSCCDVLMIKANLVHDKRVNGEYVAIPKSQVCKIYV